MAKRMSARGMNAALASGEAGVGEMTPARSPLRPRQFGVALAAAVVGGGLGMFTYHAVAESSPDYSGVVSPAQTYYLNFAADGTVLTLDVKPGQHVTKGQLLAGQDGAVAQAELTAAEAAATADAAAVAADRDPHDAAAAAAAEQAGVSQAQAAVAAAQAALSTQQDTARSTVAAQAAVVATAQSAYQADQARYGADCAAPTTTSSAAASAEPSPAATASRSGAAADPAAGPVTPAPSVTGSAAGLQLEEYCANLQSTVERDANALSSAQAGLTNLQASVQTDAQHDAADLTSSQNVLAAAQARQAAATAPADAAVIDAAEAQLAGAQAQVVTDQRAVEQTSILAPADGVVAETAGGVGALVGPDGVHGYQGPREQSGTASNGGSGFELFAPQPGRNGAGGTPNQNAYMPLITLYTAPLTVIAQVPESAIAGVHVGAAADLKITALDLTAAGTVQSTELAPVETGGGSATYYDVTIGLSSADPRIMAGMSAEVTIG